MAQRSQQGTGNNFYLNSQQRSQLDAPFATTDTTAISNLNTYTWEDLMALKKNTDLSPQISEELLSHNLQELNDRSGNISSGDYSVVNVANFLFKKEQWPKVMELIDARKLESELDSQINKSLFDNIRKNKQLADSIDDLVKSTENEIIEVRQDIESLSEYVKKYLAAKNSMQKAVTQASTPNEYSHLRDFGKFFNYELECLNRLGPTRRIIVLLMETMFIDKYGHLSRNNVSRWLDEPPQITHSDGEARAQTKLTDRRNSIISANYGSEDYSGFMYNRPLSELNKNESIHIPNDDSKLRTLLITATSISRATRISCGVSNSRTEESFRKFKVQQHSPFDFLSRDLETLKRNDWDSSQSVSANKLSTKVQTKWASPESVCSYLTYNYSNGDKNSYSVTGDAAENHPQIFFLEKNQVKATQASGQGLPHVTARAGFGKAQSAMEVFDDLIVDPTGNKIDDYLSHVESFKEYLDQASGLVKNLTLSEEDSLLNPNKLVARVFRDVMEYLQPLAETSGTNELRHGWYNVCMLGVLTQGDLFHLGRGRLGVTYLKDLKNKGGGQVAAESLAEDSPYFARALKRRGYLCSPMNAAANSPLSVEIEDLDRHISLIINTLFFHGEGTGPIDEVVAREILEQELEGDQDAIDRIITQSFEDGRQGAFALRESSSDNNGCSFRMNRDLTRQTNICTKVFTHLMQNNAFKNPGWGTNFVSYDQLDRDARFGDAFVSHVTFRCGFKWTKFITGATGDNGILQKMADLYIEIEKECSRLSKLKNPQSKHYDTSGKLIFSSMRPDNIFYQIVGLYKLVSEHLDFNNLAYMVRRDRRANGDNHNNISSLQGTPAFPYSPQNMSISAHAIYVNHFLKDGRFLFLYNKDKWKKYYSFLDKAISSLENSTSGNLFSDAGKIPGTETTVDDVLSSSSHGIRGGLTWTASNWQKFATRLELETRPVSKIIEMINTEISLVEKRCRPLVDLKDQLVNPDSTIARMSLNENYSRFFSQSPDIGKINSLNFKLDKIEETVNQGGIFYDPDLIDFSSKVINEEVFPQSAQYEAGMRLSLLALKSEYGVDPLSRKNVRIVTETKNVFYPENLYSTPIEYGRPFMVKVLEDSVIQAIKQNKKLSTAGDLSSEGIFSLTKFRVGEKIGTLDNIFGRSPTPNERALFFNSFIDYLFRVFIEVLTGLDFSPETVADDSSSYNTRRNIPPNTYRSISVAQIIESIMNTFPRPPAPSGRSEISLLDIMTELDPNYPGFFRMKKIDQIWHHTQPTTFLPPNAEDPVMAEPQIDERHIILFNMLFSSKFSFAGSVERMVTTVKKFDDIYFLPRPERIIMFPNYLSPDVVNPSEDLISREREYAQNQFVTNYLATLFKVEINDNNSQGSI